MARPIRNLTTMKGYDVTAHALACFGGAGPQHCCAIARLLGMKKIYINKYAGILSAYGLSLADVVIEKQVPFSSMAIDATETLQIISRGLDALEEESILALKQQGFSPQMISCQRYINCRYSGTDTSIMIAVSSTTGVNECLTSFKGAYMREYGFDLSGREVLIDDLRVRGTGSFSTATGCAQNNVEQSSTPPPLEHVSVYFEDGRTSTPVFKYSDLVPGNIITGPALIIQSVATVVVEVLVRIP